MLQKFSLYTPVLFTAFLFNLSGCGDSGSDSNSEFIAEDGPAKENDEIIVTSSDSNDPLLESSESSESISSSSVVRNFFEEEENSESSSSAYVPVDSSYYDAAANTLTDFRNGKVYRTTVIGTGDSMQVWMAENLNLEYNEGTAKSYCDESDPEDCSKYGRRYRWLAAMDSAAIYSDVGKNCSSNRFCKIESPVRGICPKGWHLPVSTDFEILLANVGGQEIAGKRLKASSGWKREDANGTDDFGFSVLPAGLWTESGVPNDLGNWARFWTATQVVEDDGMIYSYKATEFDFNTSDDVDVSYGLNKTRAYSIRCLLDE